MKSDTSIKNICVAAVKRHTIKPIDFAITTLFDNELSRNLLKQIVFSEGELPISQTFIDKSDWTLVTTRRIVSCFNGQVGNVLNVHIEVEKASMIIIYSIMTLVGQLKKQL